MDHIKSRDLYRWLDYVGMTEKEFDRIADHSRDPRVWTWNEKSGWARIYLQPVKNYNQKMFQQISLFKFMRLVKVA